MLKIQKLLCRVSNSKTITIEYSDLKSGKNLTDVIQKAYGPQGLGLLVVNGIPDYFEARNATLPLFWKLASLPQKTLQKYSRPQIYHSLGWSKGVQQFQGQYDQSKGSYYVNCVQDTPQKINQDQRSLFTADELKMNVGNIWVSELPQIQKNVKFLSSIMIKTGILLAQQIDATVNKKVKGYQKDHLTRIITQGTNHIGRMLNYFPFEQKGKSQDDWCGWHNDHGALTALTSAMYVDSNGKQVQVQTSDGGLFAKNRFADIARIAIPPQMLAFQLGQVTQIISGGYLQATPHCVIRNQSIAGKGISRDTFALFMEPNYLEKISIPQSVKQEELTMKQAYKIPHIKDRWKNGIYFKDFHHNTIKHYS